MLFQVVGRMLQINSRIRSKLCMFILPSASSANPLKRETLTLAIDYQFVSITACDATKFHYMQGIIFKLLSPEEMARRRQERGGCLEI